MQDKRILKSITILVVVSWAAASVFAFLFLSSRMQMVKLKNSLAISEQKAKDLSRSLEESRKARTEKTAFDKGALDYLEWQFVLKDQVGLAGAHILGELGKIKDSKDNRDLSNLLYYTLGLSYTMAVDFNSAIRAFENALDLKSDDANSLYNLGLLYSTYRNNPRKALEYYNKFLQLQPNSPKAGEVRERIKALQGK